MPEHAPAPDSTVRMDTGRPSGRPPVTGRAPTAPPAPDTPAAGNAAAAPASDAGGEADDTRPVPRDWMDGAEKSPGESSVESSVAAASTDEPIEDSAWEQETTRWAADEATADEAAWDRELAEDATATEADWHTEDLGSLAPAPEQAMPPGATAPDDPDDDTAPHDLLGGDGGPDVPGHGGRGPRGPQRLWWRRRVTLIPVAAAAVLGGAYGVDLLVSQGDIPRHTVVDGVDIGGLSPAAASQALQRSLAPRLAADRTVLAAEVTATFSPKQGALGLDVAATVEAAGHQPLNPWTRLTTLFSDRAITPVIRANPTELKTELTALATLVDKPAVEATITLEGTKASLVQPSDGRRLDQKAAAAALTAALAGDSTEPVRLPVVVAHPHVTTATAQKVLDGTVTPALAAPVTVLSQDGAKKADVPASAIAAALTFTPNDDGQLAVGIDPAKLQTALGSTFAKFGTAAKEATFAISGSSISVVPSVDGSGVDPAKLATQLLGVLTRPAPRSVTAELGPVRAAFTTEQANALGVKEQVSSFTTHFSMSPSATNIRVVAEKVNGAIVKPGETFSLNGFTGPRGTAQGYVPAVVIEGGRFTMAVGGGISQFATTMYNAAFFAGVEDVHHQPHSYYISRYPAGREATVFDGLIDLAWKNDSNTGIYVQTQWLPGSLTVTFWGTKHYTIESVSSDRSNIVTPSVQEVVDTDGKCIAQAGADGFDITVTRVFKDLGSGAVIRKENFRTHYQVEPILHCVPPPGPTPSPGPTN